MGAPCSRASASMSAGATGSQSSDLTVAARPPCSPPYQELYLQPPAARSAGPAAPSTSRSTRCSMSWILMTPSVTPFRRCQTALLFTQPRSRSIGSSAGLFQFSEVARAKKIGQLSGGEAARVALVQCLLSGAAVILLDEPTNHLDMQSTQVMERALAHFPGAPVLHRQGCQPGPPFRWRGRRE